MEQFVLYLFMLNTLLIILDAALGYFVAPLMLVKLGNDNSESSGWSTVAVRRLLTVIVAFYMFFNCLAYFGGKNIFMMIVTGVVIFDIVFQMIMRRKMRVRGETER